MFVHHERPQNVVAMLRPAIDDRLARRALLVQARRRVLRAALAHGRRHVRLEA